MPQDLTARIAARRARRQVGGVSTPASPASGDLASRIAARRQQRQATPPPTPEPADEGLNLPATGIRAISGLLPGLLPGAIAGAAGEYAAQKVEGRDDTNWTQVGVQGLLGAIPFKTAGKALWSLVRGAGSGALMAGGSEAAEQFHAGDFDPSRLATSAAIGAGVGTLGGGAVHAIAGRRAARVATAGVPTPSPNTRVTVNGNVLHEGGSAPLPPVAPDILETAAARYPGKAAGGKGGGITGKIAARRAARTQQTPGTGVLPSAPAAPDSATSKLRELFLDPARIGGPEHAETVARRIRGERGQINFERGTPAAEMLEAIEKDGSIDRLLAKLNAGKTPVPAGPGLGRSGAAVETAGGELGRPPSAASAGVGRSSGPLPDRPVDFDAPLSAEELARAAEPVAPPTRLSPAAKRRARRQKLESAIKAQSAAPLKDKTVYHGTRASFDRFDDTRMSGDDLPVHWFTDSPELGSRYAAPAEASVDYLTGANVRPSKLDITNPFDINKNPEIYERLVDEAPADNPRYIVDRLREMGYDGITRLSGDDEIPGVRVYGAFDGKQVRSIFESRPESMIPQGGHFEDLAKVDLEGVDPALISETGKLRIPAELVAVYNRLKPRWDADRLAQRAGDTGVDVPQEDLVQLALRHARRMGERSPRDFMGAERKAHAALFDRIKGMRPALREARAGLSDETGGINPDLLFDMGVMGGGAAAGAGIGAAVAEDDARGAAGGALAGGLVGMRLRRPSAFRSLQYGSMLSSPFTLAKGTVGAGGSAMLSALERGQTGRMAREILRPETLKAAGKGFMEGGAPGRYKSVNARPGTPLNPFSWPGRALGASDAAMQSAMQRAGFTPDEAADQILTGDPKSRLGRWILAMQRKDGAGGIGEDLLPFARTGVNMVERGLEAIPGVGFHPSIRGMRNLTPEQSAKKQAIGALAMLAGVASGEQAAEAEPGTWERRAWDVAPVAFGPYALLSGLAHAGSTRAHRDDATPYNVTDAAVRNVTEAVPLPEIPTPQEWLKRSIPRDATGVFGQNPSDFDTEESFTDPTLARIPFLNSLLLDYRRRNATSSSPSRRTSRSSGATARRREGR